MASLEAVSAQAVSTPNRNPQSRPRYRGARGGRHTQEVNGQRSEQVLTELHHAGQSRDPALAFRPASVAPRLQPPSSEHSDAEHSLGDKKSPVRPGTTRQGAPRNAEAQGSVAAHAPNVPTTGDVSRGVRRSRGVHGAGFTTRNATTHGSVRHFGGRLTTASEGPQVVSTSERSGLQPDAP